MPILENILQEKKQTMQFGLLVWYVLCKISQNASDKSVK